MQRSGGLPLGSPLEPCHELFARLVEGLRVVDRLGRRRFLLEVEEWRSVDLADLRRWRMLDPAKMTATGKVPAVVWNTPDGLDKLGVIAQPRGVPLYQTR
jgi:hypothetical protein